MANTVASQASIYFDLSEVTSTKVPVSVNSTTYGPLATNTQQLPISDLYPEVALSMSDLHGGSGKVYGLGRNSTKIHRFSTEEIVFFEMLRRMKISASVEADATTTTNYASLSNMYSSTSTLKHIYFTGGYFSPTFTYVGESGGNSDSAASYELSYKNAVSYYIAKNYELSASGSTPQVLNITSSPQYTSDYIQSQNMNYVTDPPEILLNLSKHFANWNGFGQNRSYTDPRIFAMDSLNATLTGNTDNSTYRTIVLASNVNPFSSFTNIQAFRDAVGSSAFEWIEVYQVSLDSGSSYTSIPPIRLKITSIASNVFTCIISLEDYTAIGSDLLTDGSVLFAWLPMLSSHTITSSLFNIAYNGNVIGGNSEYVLAIDTAYDSTSDTTIISLNTDDANTQIFNLTNTFTKSLVVIDFGISFTDTSGDEQYYFDVLAVSGEISPVSLTVRGNATSVVAVINAATVLTYKFKFVTSRQPVNNNRDADTYIAPLNESSIGLINYGSGTIYSSTDWPTLVPSVTTSENRVGVSFVVPANSGNIEATLNLAVAATVRDVTYSLPDIPADVILSYTPVPQTDVKPFEGGVAYIAGKSKYVIKTRDLLLTDDDISVFKIPDSTTSMCYTIFLKLNGDLLLHDFTAADNALQVMVRASLFI